MRIKPSPFLIAIVFLMLLNHACVPSIPREAAAASDADAAILFSDDFSKTPSGWGLWNNEGGLVEYVEGGLRVRVDDTYFDFWSVAGKNFSDVQIEVDAVKRAGPEDNDFGVVCRYQDRENFYMLVTSSDGYFGIAKVKEGEYSMIGSEQLQYSSVIQPGQALNHLRADCVGNTLRLYANGSLLMEAQDADFASGDVGLVAGAYQVKGVDILFDNFVVKTPDD
jgi:hypothetical protein